MLYVPFPFKRCTKCDKYLPFILFGRKKSTNDKLRHWCKSCQKNEAKHYKKSTSDRSDYYRNYHRNNRARKIANAQRYYVVHQDDKREYDRGYRKRRRTDERVHQMKLANWHRYKARKRTLPSDFTADDWNNCLNWWNSRCAYCGNLPGLFVGMELNADHFIALTDPDCPGTLKTNIVPACKTCNCSKSNTNPRKWISDKFGSRKAKQILKRIDDYFAWIQTDR